MADFKPKANAQLEAFADMAKGNVQALAGFIVDNNEAGVFSVLKDNSVTFTTHQEAAAALAKSLDSYAPIDAKITAEIGKLIYNNNATNGTGGVLGEIGSVVTPAASETLLCLSSRLFGLNIGCPVNTTGQNGVSVSTLQDQLANAVNEAHKQKGEKLFLFAVLVLTAAAFLAFALGGKTKAAA